MKGRKEKNRNLTQFYHPKDLYLENDSEIPAIALTNLNETNIKIISLPTFSKHHEQISNNQISKKSIIKTRKLPLTKTLYNKRAISCIPENFISKKNPEQISNFRTAYKRLVHLLKTKKTIISKAILPCEI